MLTETIRVEFREEAQSGEFFLIGMLCTTFSGFIVGVGFTLICLKLFF